ncbi:MAG: tRNA epoxyqueuosine(34) reductase QueG [Candidatus Sulfotelmatobacter sp.]
MSTSSEITNIVRKAAVDAGFELVGFAPVTDAKELEYFPRWIAEGRSGEMKYLEERDKQGRLKRASLAYAAPWARTVVVCAINYNTSQPYSTQMPDESCGWISRYAWSGDDYHESVMRRLRQVETVLRGMTSQQDAITRCYVDTGPIVERVVAKYAGIGWIGKNTCMINQTLGSWLFLGVILTSLDLASEALSLPAPDRCGTCTRCIEACPTDAFIGPYRLDANKCISYLTIEKRGAIDSEDLRSGMGRNVFGCDICQDVCPWNRKAPATSAAEFRPRPELVNPELEWLAEMNDEEFRAAFRGSPVRRAKRAGLRRNAVIAMGNSGDKKFLPVLKKLVADDEEDEVVRETGAWALRKLA